MCLSAANALPPNVGQRYAVATPKPQPCARLTAHHLRRSGHRFQTCCLVNLFFGQQHLNNELIPQMLHVCSNVRNLLCIGSVRCSFFFCAFVLFPSRCCCWPCVTCHIVLPVPAGARAPFLASFVACRPNQVCRSAMHLCTFRVWHVCHTMRPSTTMTAVFIVRK